MVIRCVIDSCRTFINAQSKEGQNKRNFYYMFPKDGKLRQLWLKKCGKKDPIDFDQSFVCAKHFKEEDFERNVKSDLLDIPLKKKLKSDAIPSLLLSSSEVQNDDSPRNSGRKQRYEERERKKYVDDDKKEKPLKRSIEVNLTSPQISDQNSSPKKLKNTDKDISKLSTIQSQSEIDDIDAAELQKLLNIILERIQCLEQELEGLNHIMEDIKGRIEKMQNRH